MASYKVSGWIIPGSHHVAVRDYLEPFAVCASFYAAWIVKEGMLLRGGINFPDKHIGGHLILGNDLKVAKHILDSLLVKNGIIDGAGLETQPAHPIIPVHINLR